MSKSLTASMEDYVEAISQIMAEKKAVRAKDIAERLNVTRPSVSGALQTLAKSELINHVPYDVITLTAKGDRIAKDIIHRHESLREFFVDILGVEAEEAETAACSVEHVVSKDIVDKLAAFVKKTKKGRKKAR
jgi:DtxR family Mn-dependent transcriptional regulator